VWSTLRANHTWRGAAGARAPVASAAVRLGLATDLHLTPEPRTGHWNFDVRYDRALDRLAAALAWFGEREVDAVLILGDLTEEGDLASLHRALDALRAGTPADAYVLGGNHDGPLLDALRDAVAPPVAVLDELTGADGVLLLGRHCVEVGDFRFCLPLGELPGGDAPLVLATHFPVVSREAVVRAQELNYAGDLVDAAEAAQTLHDRPGPTVVLCGHLHVDDAYTDGTLLQVVTPPVVEGPGTAAIVEITTDSDGGAAVHVRRELRELDGDGTSIREWTFDGARWTA